MTKYEPPDPVAKPRPTNRRRRNVLIAAAVSLTLLLGLLVGFSTSTTAGLQWLMNTAGIVSGGSLQVEVASGRLSGPLHLTALRYTVPNLRIEARDIDLDWSPAALMSSRLDIARLEIGALDIATRPTTAPLSLPGDLQLPVASTIAHALVGRLRLLAWQDKPTGTPLTLLSVEQISGEFSSDGRHHTANSLRLTTPLGAMSAVIALNGAPPFTIDGTARLEGRRDDRTYTVEARASGRLDAIDIAANALGKDFKGSATIALTPFAAVPLRTAQIDIGEIDPAAFVLGAPQAALRLQARLSPQQGAGAGTKGRPTEWILAGTVAIDNRTPGPFDRHALPLTHASADATWNDGELTLANVRLLAAGPSGGRANGHMTLREQTLRGHLDLAGIDPKTLFSTLKPARLAGDIDLSVHSDRQSIDARLNEARWRGEIAAERANGRIDVRTLRLNTGKASLEASGSIEEVGHRQFIAKGRLKDFDPSLYIASNKANLNAELDASGTLDPLAADVSFRLHDSLLITQDGPRQLTGQGQLALNADHLANTNIQLDLAGNHIDAKGAWGQPGDLLQFSADAPRLATLGFGLGGALTMTGELSGDLAHPVGHLTAAATALQLPGGIVVTKVDFSGRLGAGADSSFAANLAGSGITLGERGTTIESATLGLDGTRQAHTLHGRFVASDLGNVDLTLHGALADGLRWQGWLDRADLRLAGGALTLATAAPLSAAPDHVTLGAAELRGETTRLNLQESHWSSADWQTRGSLSGLRIDVAADPAAPEKIHGILTVGGVWDVRARDHVEGSLRLVREAGDITLSGDKPLTLGLSEVALAATAVHDSIEATLLATGERLGKLQGSAAVRLEHVDGRWRLARTAPLLADAKVDVPSLQWLGPLLNPNLNIGGHASGEIHIAGTLAKLEARGSLQADALSIVLIDQGLRLDDGSLHIDLLENRARLSAFSFRTEPRSKPPAGMRLADPALAKMPGWLKGSGEISLLDGSGELRFDAEHLAILQRPDRWLMLSGTGKLKTVDEVLAVDGALRADAGYFELAAQSPPSLGDDVIVRRRGVKESGESPTERKAPLRFTVDLGLDLGPRLYFKGRGIDTRLAGELRLRADKPGALRASGSIRTQDGTFDAYGQSLAIERGVLNFHGPIGQPSLNVLALRKGLAVEAGVEITGSVDSPKVRLISYPEVPDPEKLSWIVVGHGLDQAGADNALLLSAAGAILGGPNGGSLTRSLANGLGLDQISLTQGNPNAPGSLLPATTVAGSTARSDSTSLSSQIVTLGKRLGDNAYLSYEQSLVGSVNVVKLTYQLSRRLSLVGRAGTDNAADLTYTFSFH